ncbi:hypothetical protein CVT26_005262 [Gymnopilus dilepis]|uniref:RlpA-like protein double-psi beta-barrel domain-containing protein n=1 Tax=Gymnopilus dilepis TaxID=231916 RepID=A0A409YVL7_9AGAR|nr:hypothetical protein CVT26_005262 [Gymnopilus dilepis]
MIFPLALSLSLLAWTPSFGAYAGHEYPGIFHRHQEVAKRSEGDVQLFKRVPNARLSWYNGETGNAGSCGQLLSNSDAVCLCLLKWAFRIALVYASLGQFVAVNAEQMNSAWCFKTIRITYGGQTAIATIKDTCPSSSCPWGGLDLSPSLFSRFADQGIGIIHGDWEFTDAPTEKPSPTSTYHPPPPPPTTSSTSKTHTTSHVVPTSTSSHVISSSAALNATSSLSSSAAPTSSVVSVPVGNLETLNEILIQYAGIITTGSKL